MMVDAIDKVRSALEDLISNKRALIKILSILLVLMLAFLLKSVRSDSNEISIESAAVTPESEELYVDIGGAVERPGVYKVQAGTRLYEVIEMAGGIRSDADTYTVNQAAFVTDGDKVIIPIASNLDPEYARDFDFSLININTASKEQLCSLTGIGDVIADRIIEYRTSNRFKTKEDIMSVNGIGASIFEKIEDSITV